MSEYGEDIKRIPWLEYLIEGQPCEGIRWSAVPGKALRPWGPGRIHPATGLDPYRCKKTAHWKFTALPEQGGMPAATSGVYCWSHLHSAGLQGSMDEADRFHEWLEKEGLA
jgi:hypothetical protein